MINSLFKDSHITHGSHPLKPGYIEKSVYKSTQNNMVRESSNINFNKSARISFSGLSSYKLADSDNFKSIVNNAKTFLGKDASTEQVKELLLESVNVVRNVESKAGEKVNAFLKTQKENISSLIEQTKLLLKGEKAPIEEMNENIGAAVDILPKLENKEKPNSIFTNKHVQSFFRLANKSEAVFSALFAIGLTCILRPAAIMSLPGKKNKEDKIYASAHSIASGIIGYLISLALFKPISGAVAKVPALLKSSMKNKAGYLKNDRAAMDAAKTCLNMLPDTIFSPIKATITVALIPPILKHVFGWEKKKGPENKNQSLLLQNLAAVNFKSSSDSNRVALHNIMGGSK